jgi:hypothetical protein
MAREPITNCELIARVEAEVEAMPQHKGKGLRFFVTARNDGAWTIGIHAAEGTMKTDAQAHLDAIAISNRLQDEFQLARYTASRR